MLDYHLPPRTQPSPSPPLFWNILLAPWLVSQLLSQPLRMVPPPSPNVTLITLLSAVYVAPPPKLCLISSPPGVLCTPRPSRDCPCTPPPSLSARCSTVTLLVCVSASPTGWMLIKLEDFRLHLLPFQLTFPAGGGRPRNRHFLMSSPGRYKAPRSVERSPPRDCELFKDEDAALLISVYPGTVPGPGKQ